MRQKDKVLGAEIVGGLREASTPWAGVSLLNGVVSVFGPGRYGEQGAASQRFGQGA